MIHFYDTNPQKFLFFGNGQIGLFTRNEIVLSTFIVEIKNGSRALWKCEEMGGHENSMLICGMFFWASHSFSEQLVVKYIIGGGQVAMKVGSDVHTYMVDGERYDISGTGSGRIRDSCFHRSQKR